MFLNTVEFYFILFIHSLLVFTCFFRPLSFRLAPEKNGSIQLEFYLVFSTFLVLLPCYHCDQCSFNQVLQDLFMGS